MDKRFTDAFGDVVTSMFKEISDSDLTDFYHANRYTVTNDENEVVVQYVIPGADGEGLSVEVKGGALYVEAKKNELFSGLKDVFAIQTNIDLNGISALYKNGVLIIKLPFIKHMNDDGVVEITLE